MTTTDRLADDFSAKSLHPRGAPWWRGSVRLDRAREGRGGLEQFCRDVFYLGMRHALFSFMDNIWCGVCASRKTGARMNRRLVWKRMALPRPPRHQRKNQGCRVHIQKVQNKDGAEMKPFNVLICCESNGRFHYAQDFHWIF